MIVTTLEKNYFQPPLALAHLPLADPQTGYYRSKIFQSSLGINPLITCACTLLVLVGQLREGFKLTDSHELYAMLVHEIKAFETSAQNKGYHAEHVLVARYLLCATLDEVVLVNENFNLLQHFHGEIWGGERFFLILDRLSFDPVTHRDLLELIYVCLNLGFTGKYRQREHGRMELDFITEKLYDSISSHRSDSKKPLLVSERFSKPIKTMPVSSPLPFWLAPCFAALIFAILYLGFSFMLESSAAPLYQELNSIAETYADN